MPKISSLFFSLFSEIKKRFHHIHLRSRRPSLRMGPTIHLVDSTRPFFIKLNFILKALSFVKSDPQAQLDQTQTVQCHFCQQPCRISNYYQLEAKGQLKGWACHRHAHPVEYIAVPDATYYAFMFTCWHKDRKYSIEGYKLPQGEQWNSERVPPSSCTSTTSRPT